MSINDEMYIEKANNLQTIAGDISILKGQKEVEEPSTI